MAGRGDEEAAAVNIHIRVPFPNAARFSVEVDLNSSVEDLKAVVAERSGIPAELQRLIYKGRVLMQGGRTLESFGVEDNEIIHLVRGGAASDAAVEMERILAVVRSDPFVESLEFLSEEDFRRTLSMSEAREVILSRISIIFDEDNQNLLHFLLSGTDQINHAAAAAVAAGGGAVLPAEERYATQLSQLQELGFFDIQENIRALTVTAGNVRAAIRRLLDIRHNLRSF